MGDRYVQEARAGGNASVREGRAQGEGEPKSLGYSPLSLFPAANRPTALGAFTPPWQTWFCPHPRLKTGPPYAK